ncbi:MAG: Na+/H+ antiporter NhaA [Candidatus Planktophila sp.]
MASHHEVVLGPVSDDEGRWLAKALKDETFGGILLLAAAALAMIIANSYFSLGYSDLLDRHLSIGFLDLDMSILHWISDGLLAIFFLVAGLELKHELLHGSLSKPSQALVPVVAALAGMGLPILLYTLLVRGNADAHEGWAIPMATDIAFALAVLAIAGKSLPTELRAFLLTVAVVDDLGAISVIAIFYSNKTDVGMLALTIILLAIYWVTQRLNIARWYIALPLGLAIWWATYQSGVHATVAGIAIALLTRNHNRNGELLSPAEISEKYLRPVSVTLVIPLFAFASAGVDIRSFGLSQTITSSISVAIIISLVFGKAIGIFGATYLVTRLTKASLNPVLRWTDVMAIGLLAGIGFTVSLLIAELSYEDSPTLMADAKVGILAASLLASVLAVIALRIRASKVVD